VRTSIVNSDMREAERFISATDSDFGIANVNIGPSGAGIGGALGGEKETGGGREAGSHSWRAHTRRAIDTLPTDCPRRCRRRLPGSRLLH
jgi:aldehyde dehydrogenase (NAD+)